MKLKPVNDRIIIERDDAIAEDTQTASGIYIPAVAQEKPQTATVIAVGPGLYEERQDKNGSLFISTFMPVQAGDRIIIGKYSGAEITHDGHNYTIIGPKDIFAIIKDN